MAEKSNNYKTLFVIFLILTLVLGGFIVYDKFMKEDENKDSTNVENNTNMENNTNLEDNTNCQNVENNASQENNITFSDYAKKLENKDVEEEIFPELDFSAILGVSFKNGEVYFLFKDESELKQMGLNADINKIKNLKLENNRYKLPLKDIVLVDGKKVGQDGSTMLLFEDKNGKVYSFHCSQTGAFNYPLFNDKNEINIEEEPSLNNIIKFGSYGTSNDSVDVFGIDINGNIVYHKDY